MKKLTTFFSLFSILGALYAQIPGGNFEHWKSLTFEYPTDANWTVYSERTSTESAGLLEKSTDASHGSYAVKFNTYGTEDIGYVVYGQVDEGPSGGIPFADNPTQLTISYKCNLAVGDTAQVWVFLFSAGEQITNDILKITGVQAEYTDITFDLSSYTESPDSIMFALVPDDPFVDKIRTAGNFICFDNARLVGGTNNTQIPDNSFEDWTSIHMDYTAEMKEISALVEKTDDAYNGTYAMKMSTQNAQWYEGKGEGDESGIDRDATLTLWGKREYIKVDDNWEGRNIGGLPISERKDTLVF